MGAIRLYEEDSHLQSCRAVVTGCAPWKDGGYAVTLQQTVFFPEGGGQPADTGTLTAGGRTVQVTDVRERDGEVYHLTDAPLEPGQEAEAAICWARRLDHIQQHTGEHILSHAVWHLFGVNNIGFHLGARVVTIDLDRALTREELDRAEDYANDQVFQNRPVTARVVPAGELGRMKLRKTTDKVTGDLRVVEVEGGDRCTCCGTHAGFTGEVGLIKILRQDSHKGGVRLSFLCGGRALLDYRAKHHIVQEAGALFSAGEEGVVPAILRLREESAATGTRLRDTAVRLMDYRARELIAGAQERNGQRALVAIQEDCSPAEARMLLTKLLEAPALAVGLVARQGDKLNFLIGRSGGSTADCRFLCDLLGGLLGGKGGGREDFCQGSAKAAPGWQAAAGMLLDHMLPR